MDLSGSQLKQLSEALLSAFPRIGDLKRMVLFGLDENLEAIAGSGKLEDVVFNLVEWARRKDRTGDLTRAAREANATNPKLAAFAASLEWPAGGQEEDRSEETRPLFEVPHRRNRNFSGREAQLAEIKRRLAEGETTLAIAGLGGLGKTQIALEYCYQEQDSYGLIYWLPANEAAALGAALALLAQKLGLAVEAGDQEALRRLLFSRLEELDGRWLLIYDNADDITPKDLDPYLPRSGKDRHILITSRSQAFRGIARVLKPGEFEPQEARAFLQQRSGLQDEAGAGALAKALGYLPLALEHAAAYVEQKGVSYAGYQKRFAERRSALWAKSEPPDAYHATAATTWELSLEQLAEQEAAIQLLELCSFLAAEDIPLRCARRWPTTWSWMKRSPPWGASPCLSGRVTAWPCTAWCRPSCATD